MKAQVHAVSEHWVSLQVVIEGKSLVAQYHSHDCLWGDGRLLGLKDGATPFHVSPAPIGRAEFVELTEHQQSAIRQQFVNTTTVAPVVPL